MTYGEVTMRINEKTFADFIGELFGIENRICSPEYGDIVVWYEDGEIKNILDSDKLDGPLLFGDEVSDRNIPAYIKTKTGKYNYNPPINNSYANTHSMLKKSEKYKNENLEASRFNVVFNDAIAQNPAFSFMRMRSSDVMPRFVFYFDESKITKLEAEQIIKKILIM